MADVKYGRMFTEQDVRDIVRRAMEQDIQGEDELAPIIDNFEGKFPKDEPTFTLRAQDKRAIGAIRFYADHQSPRASMNHLDRLESAQDAFDDFRIHNANLMKEPD